MSGAASWCRNAAPRRPPPVPDEPPAPPTDEFRAMLPSEPRRHLTEDSTMSETADLPRGIGAPATRAFELAGYTRLEQFTQARARDLLALHGVGPKAISVLGEALAERGLAFEDD
jgi:hypothetical protein